jgi:hypothetical protein
MTGPANIPRGGGQTRLEPTLLESNGYSKVTSVCCGIKSHCKRITLYSRDISVPRSKGTPQEKYSTLAPRGNKCDTTVTRRKGTPQAHYSLYAGIKCNISCMPLVHHSLFPGIENNISVPRSKGIWQANYSVFQRI